MPEQIGLHSGSHGPVLSSGEATTGPVINVLPNLHSGRKFRACESIP